MVKVITYGTFDLLHRGHINILKRARVLGDYLIVAVSTDEFNIEKGKDSYMPYKERKGVLEAIRYVDLVIPEVSWKQKREDILRNKVDIFVIGNDWEGKFDFLSDICKVIYLPRTQGISSTSLRTQVQERFINVR